MTIGRMVAIFVGCLVIGVIAGLVTRNLIVAITFPFLLVAFLLMWRNLKENAPKELEETQEQEKKEAPQDELQTVLKQSQQEPESQESPPQAL